LKFSIFNFLRNIKINAFEDNKPTTNIMQKNMRMPAIFFCLVLFISPGCEKDPPIQEEKPINIELSVSNLNPDYMGTTTVSWKVTGDYDRVSVSVNSQVISTETTGKKILSEITSDNVVTVSAFQKGQNEPTKIKTATISVKTGIAPVVTFTATPTSIIRGESVTVFWEILGEIKSIECDLPGFSGLGGAVVISPTENITYTLSVHWKGGIEARTFSITVNEPPPPTMADTLCSGPWRKVKLEFQMNEGPWYEADIWECSKDDRYTFSLPNILFVYNGEPCGGEPISSTGTWTLVGNALNTGNVKYIQKVTMDTLIWVYSFSSQSKTRETFVH
jgi:hypothetical protein